ncbi:MAG: maltose ABC transporter permease MalG [Pseudomonadota bacterium]
MAIVVDRSNRWRILAAHVAIICLIALVLFPFLVILSISLRPGNFAVGSLIPKEITLDHWRLALGLSFQGPNGNLVAPDFPVLRWLWNSIKVATITACVSLLLATTCAYAFARMKFRFKSQALATLMLLQMFPAVLATIAFYSIFNLIGSYVPWLGIESHGGLVLAYTGGIAIHIWTIKGYYDTIPVEIEEAAKVDGATPWQAFVHVLMPMALPILMVVFLLAFIGAMNEYPIASILLREQNNMTLAIGMKLFLYEQKYLWGDFAAAAILSGLPITAVFLLSQRWMISGLTSGGVKG